MNKFDATENHQRRKIFSRIMLVVISVVIIVCFIPRNGGPQFRYDVGKPWMYGSLIAKFDFPIYKTDEAIKEERDSMMHDFEPYYNFNPEVESKQLTKFFEDFREGMPGMPKNFTSLVADKLHNLYQQGIMSPTEYSSMAKDTSKVIRLVEGKMATSVKVSDVMSTMGAY